MCLDHFALIDRLDVLRELLTAHHCYTTELIREELHNGLAERPLLQGALELDWVEVIPLDTVPDLLCLDKWVRRIGAGKRDMGEASVFAAAERSGGIAITDDQAASRVARKFELEVHGTLWLLAEACNAKDLTIGHAGNLIDSLQASGMRLPCTGSEFELWSRKRGLLTPLA
ncbi:hypothetical protein FG87_17215 [Nocardia vulneris]|uniref:PIN domain-containing protein n=2 Tax=Nocardia vulneris TaxID=1141657 RepID=A0ABR4ZET1_9NOCA|nr:hypothetical protein FG87_17215 [Nocardia vulneris]